MQTKSNLARADTFSWSWWSYSAVMPVSVRSDPGIIWRGLNSCVESGEWFSCSPGVDPAHTELVCTSNRRYDRSTGRQSDKKNSFPWADHEEWVSTLFHSQARSTVPKGELRRDKSILVSFAIILGSRCLRQRGCGLKGSSTYEQVGCPNICKWVIQC